LLWILTPSSSPSSTRWIIGFAGQSEKLRGRGPEPTLSDSEVLTMEIVGEFLGIDDENGLYAYFRRHYAEWFPALREVHRTTFTPHSDARKG
jgi:hypothetical protein